jgi:AcrR family transcriptional regulator
MQTGKDLFWKYGIKRVTVEEICREAGVSKMTFYKYFRNKNELVRAIIDQITGDALDQYKALMQQDIPFEEKVRETIRLKYEGTDQMSQEFLNDYLPEAEPEILEFVRQRTREVFGLILEDYRMAQQRGDIRKDIKIEFILYFLNKMVELMGDKELERLYGSPRELIMELVNFFFYGIMPRQN